ncbi:hypothetical protein JMC51_001333 [Vibrio parahaemolyticus]|nr:hypothetical protein [Vibrio parahaemolyticus]EHA6973287.1 hypothetical protein [Vibrio parahaemolyticus]
MKRLIAITALSVVSLFANAKVADNEEILNRSGVYYYSKLGQVQKYHNPNNPKQLIVREYFNLECYVGSDQNPYNNELEDWYSLPAQLNKRMLSDESLRECRTAINVNKCNKKVCD